MITELDISNFRHTERLAATPRSQGCKHLPLQEERAGMAI